MCSERPDLGSERLDLGSERPGLGSERPDLGSDRLDLGSVRANLGSERPELGSERGLGACYRLQGGRTPETGDNHCCPKWEIGKCFLGSGPKALSSESIP